MINKQIEAQNKKQVATSSRPSASRRWDADGNVRKISFISTGYDAYDIFYLMISFLVSYRRYRSYAVPNSINSNVAQIAGQCH